MATSFMTEEEAEAVIETHLEEILSKVRCATSSANSTAAGPGTNVDGIPCGCCGT
jgi:hypothetical protein